MPAGPPDATALFSFPLSEVYVRNMAHEGGGAPVYPRYVSVIRVAEDQRLGQPVRDV